MNYAHRQIQAKMEEGVLPWVPPVRVSVNYGMGHACAGCDTEIRRSEVMHEAILPGGRTLAFHGACEIAWRELIAAHLASVSSRLQP